MPTALGGTTTLEIPDGGPLFSHGADPRNSVGYAPPRDGLHMELHPDDIVKNPANPRRRIRKLDDLESIATAGIVTALAVVPRELWEILYPERVGELVGEGRFVLLAGERRWTKVRQLLELDAAGEAALSPKIKGKLLKLPVIVHTDKDRRELDQFGLQENGGRDDLLPLDEAQAYADYMATYQIRSINALATELGLPYSHVYKRLELLKMPDDAQELIDAGELGPETAFKLKDAGDRLVEAWHLTQDPENPMSPKSAVAAVTGGVATLSRPRTEPTVEADEEAAEPEAPASSSSPPKAAVKLPTQKAAKQKAPEQTPEAGTVSVTTVSQVREDMSPEDREIYRRECVGILVSKRFLSMKDSADVLATMILDGRQLPRDGEQRRETLAMAEEWLGRSTTLPKTPPLRLDAALAAMFAEAELTLSRPGRELTILDGYYLSVLKRGVGYVPSADEEEAIDRSTKGRS